SNESCLSAAVKAAWMAMKHVGGKLIICASSIASVGPNALKSTKENLRLLNTDREIEMLKPTMEGFKELAADLTRVQITAEMFLTTNMYMDIASISPLARYTGGDIRYYPGFRADIHGEKLREELQHVCTRDMGWEAVMRVRVSKGWKVTNFYGHMFVRTRDLLVVPNCHEDQTFSITLEPDADVKLDPFVCVQCALLFTTSNGERRIRVHTVQLPTTGNIDEVLDTTDPEAATGLMASLACDKAMEANSKLSDARNLIQNTIGQIVTSTQSHIEAVRPLPLHVLGLLKSPMFRATSDVPSDQRVYYWTRHESISLPLQAALFYPRMFAVHQLSGDEGTVDPNTERVVLPHCIALSAENMTGDGIYLQEDGESILMWIGKAVSPQLLHSLFNIPSLDQLALEMGVMWSFTASQRVTSIIDQLRLDRAPPMMQLILVPQGSQYEVRFFSNLIEDKTIGMQMSYQEFLHRIGGSNQPR
ncbi:vesicle transport protein, putative, partial [Perkinsus marinus ATCC 50983]